MGFEEGFQDMNLVIQPKYNNFDGHTLHLGFEDFLVIQLDLTRLNNSTQPDSTRLNVSESPVPQAYRPFPPVCRKA
jgi:hypothetical protein